MPAFDIKSITGVIPAMVTPFDENEKLDEKRLRAVVNFLIESDFRWLLLAFAVPWLVALGLYSLKK